MGVYVGGKKHPSMVSATDRRKQHTTTGQFKEITIKFPALTDWQQPVFNKFTSMYSRDMSLKKEFAQSPHRYVIKSARQRGKSFLIQVLLLYIALKKKFSYSMLVEPTLNQSRRMFKQMCKALEDTGLIKKSNQSLLEIVFKNGSEIVFRSGEQGDNLRGETITGILVYDEAAYLTDNIFDICQPMVNVHKSPIFYFSTPLFSEGKFYKEWTSSIKSLVHNFDWVDDKYDYSKFISQEMIDDYRQTMTPLQFKTEILGEFIDGQSFVFGDFKSCIGTATSKDVAYIGIDWGSGSDGDSTVVVMMNSNREVVDILATNDMSPTEQVDWIADLINKHKQTLKRARVESNSIGTIYADLIAGKIYDKNVLDVFYTGNTSKREIVEKLILAFQNSNIVIPDDRQLIKQLSAFQMKKTKTGKVTYANASDSVHDDYVMALCFAYSLFDEDPVQEVQFNGGFGYMSHKED